MSSQKPCPKCGNILVIPNPPPEGIRCPLCESVLSLRGMKGAPLEKQGLAPARATTHVAAKSPVAPKKSGSGLWVIGGIVAVLLLAGVIVGVDWALREGDGQDAKKPDPLKEKEKDSKGDVKPIRVEGPQILIDEDFERAYKDKQSIPKGWSEGEAFVAVKEMDLHALKLTKATGYHFVQLPRVLLAGDFAIECGYHLTGAIQKFTLRLEDRGNLALLPIVVDYTGKVLIADDVRAGPPGFDSRKPVRMLVKREGKKISILLNGGLIGSKNLDTAAAFDTIKLGLGEGSDYYRNFPRIFGVRVSSLAP